MFYLCSFVYDMRYMCPNPIILISPQGEVRLPMRRHRGSI
jgi:hypothetical protein